MKTPTPGSPAAALADVLADVRLRLARERTTTTRKAAAS